MMQNIVSKLQMKVRCAQVLPFVLQRISSVVEESVSCRHEPGGRCLVTIWDVAGLPGAWQALRELSEAEPTLRRLAESFLERLLLPIATAGASVKSQIAAEGSGRTLSVSLAGSQSSPREPEGVELALLDALSFISGEP